LLQKKREEEQRRAEEARRQQQAMEEMKKKHQQLAAQENARRMEELRRKQQEEQARRLEENRRQMEISNRKRIEQAAELLKKKAEEERQRQDEQQRREQEAARRKEEQRAMLAIQKVIQQVRIARPEGFDELKKEMEVVLAKELEKTGPQKDRIKAESAKAVEQAQERIDKVKELERLQEERKAEEERRQKEARELARKLLKEFEKLVESAEAATKILKEQAEPLLGENEVVSLPEVSSAAKAVDEAGADAQGKAKACTDFMIAKGKDLKVPPLQGEKSEEVKAPTFQELLQRVGACTRANESTIRTSSEARDRAARRAEATGRLEEQAKVFDKYDKDHDGLLNRQELITYAKGEQDFAIGAEALDRILRILGGEKENGVKKIDLHRLKVSVGVARELEIDKERRAAKAEAERVLAERKQELQEQVAEAAKVADVAEEDMGKAEKQVTSLFARIRTLTASEMVTLADETDEFVKDARTSLANAKGKVDSLKATEVQQELQSVLAVESRKLETRVNRIEPRLQKSIAASGRFREDASKKQAEEFAKLRAEVLAMLHRYQAKKALDISGLFAAFDTSNKGQIDESDFLAFLEKREGEELAVNGKKEEKEEQQEKGDTDAASPDEDKDETLPDFPPVPADKAASSQQPRLPVDDLRRLFKHLDEDNAGHITMSCFHHIVRRLMKIKKETVITEGICIKDSKTLRRLGVNEVVEVLEGPVMDESVEVERIRVKVMKDGLEGWVTPVGNQGTVFLEAGGNLFRVVKETILTNTFEMQGDKEATRKLKETTRKLKEGELVEVREWAKKEESSGLLRMRVRAKSDGHVGWATMVGNQGTVFLQVA